MHHENSFLCSRSRQFIFQSENNWSIFGGRQPLSMERLRNTLQRYAADHERTESASARASKAQLEKFRLNLHLSTLFPKKQKELIFKKLEGSALTKTEQEYYSRVVKKKLEALANVDVQNIAMSLTQK